MHKGIYIALSGAVLKHTQMEVISQNLSNADTTAFKKDNVSFKDYLIPQEVISFEPDGRVMSDVSSFTIDFSVGNLVKTGNLLDIAVEGNGFIALEGNRYTKRGDLQKDGNGYLTSYNGIRVMGSNGPIQLPEGIPQISEAGEVSVNGTAVDTIKVVALKELDKLSKVGESIFKTSEETVATKARVKQGYLEKSNVSVIREMLHMIETSREFETFQKAIQFFDEAAGKVNNEIGRV
jgi:flagellar basal-body rod protein FlgF